MKRQTFKALLVAAICSGSLVTTSDSSNAGTWLRSPDDYPRASFEHDPVEYGGYIFLIGGAAGNVPGSDAVYAAKVHPDGPLGPWTLLPDAFPVIVGSPGITAYNGWLYASELSEDGRVYRARIVGDGSLGPWLSETPAAPWRAGAHRFVAINGYLYILGGWQPSSTFFSDVFFARINDDGSLGPWTSTTSMPQPRQHQTVHFLNNRIYVVGGITSGLGILDSVVSASVNSDGTVGAWRSERNLPVPLWMHGATFAKGELFIFGGRTGYCSGETGAIYRGAIDPATGTLSEWALDGQLPDDYLLGRGSVYVPSTETFYLIAGLKHGCVPAPEITGNVWYSRYAPRPAPPSLTWTASSIGNDGRCTRTILLADLDGDGDKDLLASNENGPNQIYLNNGTANPFSTAIDIDPDGFVCGNNAADIGDVDHDGDLDIVTACYMGNQHRLYLNNGTADPFNGIDGIPIAGDQGSSGSILLGDFDGDGWLDLVVGSTGGGGPAKVYLNNRTPNPFAGVTGQTVAAVGTATLAAADVNGDGRLDLFTGNGGGPSLLHLNVGPPALFDLANTQAITTDPPASPTGRAAVFGDVNGDARLDLVYSTQVGLRVYLNNGSSEPYAGGYDPIGSGTSYDPVLGDMDGDGRVDLIVAGPHSTSPRLYVNNRTSHPWDGVEATTIFEEHFTFPTGLAVGDVDEDDVPDVVAGYYCDPKRLYLTKRPRDNTPPTISCPADIRTNTAEGTCFRTVKFHVTATDDSGSVSVSCAPDSDSAFPKGTTTVNCTATDAATNTAKCSFTVTVEDNEKPTISCPANLTQSTALGQCSAVVDYPPPTASDNCPGVITSCTPPSSSTFSKGTTTVTCTATDASGNTASCSFSVTVEDEETPKITCPANIVAGCSLDLFVPVDFTAKATDNCDPAPTVTCTPSSGSGFPVGLTIVHCTATDSSGNTDSCSFNVTRAALWFAGFLPPIGGADATGGTFDNPVRTFKMGSTIPVKLTVGCDGSPILTGIHRLQVIKYSNDTTAGDPIDASPQDAATTGNQFRWVDSQWQFNLDTKATGMSVGKWQIVATLSDDSQHSAWIQLK